MRMKDLLVTPPRRRWWSHPLLHFVLFGAVAFGLQSTFGGDDASEIVLSQALVEEFRTSHLANTGREVSDDELRQMLAAHRDEEMLLREALAMELDRGDLVVRSRLVSKLVALLSDLEHLSDPTDEELTAMMAENPERWVLPPRLDFEQVYYRERGTVPSVADGSGDGSGEGSGEGSGAEGSGGGVEATTALGRATEALRQLRAGASAEGMGESFASGARIVDFTEMEIARDFGSRFPRDLENLPIGEWSGPFRGAHGVHVVRMLERRPGGPATLDDVRSRLTAEWRSQHAERSRVQFLQRLRERYRVVDESGLLDEGSATGGAP